VHLRAILHYRVGHFGREPAFINAAKTAAMNQTVRPNGIRA